MAEYRIQKIHWESGRVSAWSFLNSDICILSSDIFAVPKPLCADPPSAARRKNLRPSPTEEDSYESAVAPAPNATASAAITRMAIKRLGYTESSPKGLYQYVE
jgi:hypothetical protein